MPFAKAVSRFFLCSKLSKRFKFPKGISIFGSLTPSMMHYPEALVHKLLSIDIDEVFGSGEITYFLFMALSLKSFEKLFFLFEAISL